jgi:hypothetical protein
MDHDDDDFGGENEDDEDDVAVEDEEINNEELRMYLIYKQEYEDLIRSLVDNDPTLTSLSVGIHGTVRLFNANDWGILGRAIGMSTQLTELTLRNGLPTDDLELASLLSGLAMMNRSIQTLNFKYFQLNNNMIELIAPFLADNQVFHHLEVYLHDRMDIKTTQLCLASFLLMFDYLREFRLDYIGPTVHLDIIIQALTVHTELMKLQLCGITIGRRGYDSLVKLLIKSTKLKKVAFREMRGLSDDGWQNIFTALQYSTCKLEEFEMRGVQGVNERTAVCLSDALLHHSTTLKSLQFHENECLLVVIPLLQDPNAILEELCLQSYDADSMTNEEIEALTIALATNSTG